MLPTARHPLHRAVRISPTFDPSYFSPSHAIPPLFSFFFLMIRRPPRSTLFPYTRSSDLTAKAAGWGQPLPAGVFRGIAQTEAYGSYTSAVAELSVNANGEVDLKRLVLGIDPGYAVNPDNIQAQMQGSAVFMLTAMFWGEITIKDGRVEQSNFHDYRMMRLRAMPRVEVVLAPSGGFWGGVGEPGQASIAPAVCNAIFAATGKRVRSLPLKNH